MLLGHGEIGGCWWCAFCFLLSALYDRDAIATDEHGLARMNRTVRDWAHAKPRSREAAKPRSREGESREGESREGESRWGRPRMLLGQGEIGGCCCCAFCFLLFTLCGRDAIATDEHGFARMNRR